MTSVENKKFYLGGPMTGYPDYNFPAFTKTAETLRTQFGLEIVSAHEVDHGEHTGAGTQPYAEYIRGDLKEMLNCEGAIFLQGWPDSKGAKLEFELALLLDFPIFQFMDNELGSAFLIPLRKPDYYG